MSGDNPDRDTEPGRARDGNGKFAKTVESAERDTEAARLFSRGHTYQQIADELGYGDKRNAYRGVKDAFAAIPAETVPELRAGQMSLIAELKQAALGVLGRDHYTISQGGKIVEKDDVPLLDDGPILAAINTLDRLLARESLIAGTAAVTRSKVDLGGGTERDEEIDALIAQYREQRRRQTNGQDGAAGA